MNFWNTLFTTEKKISSEEDSPTETSEIVEEDSNEPLEDMRKINDRFECILEHKFGSADLGERLQHRFNEEHKNHQKELDLLKSAFQQKEKQNLNEIGKLNHDIADLNQRLNSVIARNEELEAQNKNLSKQREDISQKLSNAQKDFDKALERMETERNSLQIKLEALQNEHDKLLKESLVLPNEDVKMALLKENMSKEVANARKKMKKHYDEMRQAHAKKLEKECNEKLSSMQKDKDGLSQMLEEKNKMLEELNADHTKMADERIRYLEELQQAKKDKDEAVEALAAELVRKNNQINDLKKEMKHADALYNRLGTYCDHIETVNTPIHEEINKLKKLCGDMESVCEHKILAPAAKRRKVVATRKVPAQKTSEYENMFVTPRMTMKTEGETQ